MKSLLREPLVHFLILGTALFGLFALMQGPAPAPTKEIRLTLDELTQLARVFQAQWRREPTPEELAQLIENKVQNEVLYREAMTMGLDKDDEIVKRRMAQKMQFLAEDVGAAREPTADELKSQYEQDKSRFAQPNRVSFRHLYFSPDRRGSRARDEAANTVAKLVGEPQDLKGVAASPGDPFMFQNYYRDRTPEFLGKEFGPQFALAIGKMSPGAWQGPIQSGLGWHLVFVDTVIAGRVPPFEEIESEVKTAWLTEERTKAWQRAYDKMRAKYKVLMPAPPDADSVGAASPAPVAKGPAS